MHNGGSCLNGIGLVAACCGITCDVEEESQLFFSDLMYVLFVEPLYMYVSVYYNVAKQRRHLISETKEKSHFRNTV